MKIFRLGILMAAALALVGCPKRPEAPAGSAAGSEGGFFQQVAAAKARGAEDVVRERFPQCFEEPRVGASSGARCDYDGKTREWRIVLWRGWGDCPAGCIDKEDYARYVVKPDGRVIEENQGGAEAKAKVEKSTDLTCAAADECFFYECCESRVMSKTWRQSHWQELSLDGPGRESCNLKCVHEFSPAGRRPACVARQCMMVDKGAPAIDPNRPVAWIGKSVVVPQCEDPALWIQGDGAWGAGAPVILLRSATPGVTPGPKFNAWAKTWEDERQKQAPDQFRCKACAICSAFARVYALVYADEIGKFTSGPAGWRRVDE